MPSDELLSELITALQNEERNIPSVIEAFHGFASERFPPERRGKLLEAAKTAFAQWDGPPQLAVAPGINLRWGLPDGSQQTWFLTVRDDDDPEGQAFFTIRLKDESAGLLAAWCLHLQRIRVPGARGPETEAQA